MKKILFIFFLISTAKLFAQEALFFGGVLDLEDTAQFKYILTDSNNFWFLGTPEKDSLSLPSNHGENAAFTDTSVFYRSNVRSFIQFKLLRYGNIHCIRFYQKYDFEKNADGGMLETSYDNGRTWQNIIFDPLIMDNLWNDHNLYKETDTVSALDKQPGFTGKLLSGGHYEICWYDYDSYNDTMLIRFKFASDSVYSENEGWLLDDFGFGIIIEDKVKTHEENVAVWIQPNPAQERIYVHGIADPISKIEIYSPSGHLISVYAYPSEIDISELLPGLYILRCHTKLSYTYNIRFCKR